METSTPARGWPSKRAAVALTLRSSRSRVTARGSAASGTARLARGLVRAAGEVLRRDLVEEVLELLDDLLLVLDLVLELDRGLLDDVLGGVDRAVGAHGQ